MRKIIELFEKTVVTIKEEGLFICLQRIRNYIKLHWKRQKKQEVSTPDAVYMDVLFINGCYLPHPARYRVTHQREQLEAAGISTNEIFYENISLELVKHYRVFIFFRCVYKKEIEEFITLAKEMNKLVLFDIDDLVIDCKYTNGIPYLATMSAQERKQYDDGVRRMQQTLRLCDGAITTTERLAKELQKYVKEVWINRNTASEIMVYLSKKEIRKRDFLPFQKVDKSSSWQERREIALAKKQYEKRKKSGIRLGYFSGSITHNDDFVLIESVVARLLEEYPDLEFHIVGELDVPSAWKFYKKQIKTHPFVPFDRLPRLIASVDINLAPLQQTIFNEAKSENKWVEASLVKVPTVASNVGAFAKMIQQNVTGFLCETEKEWYQALKDLIEQESLRKQIGENAYEYVLQHCTTVYQSTNLADYIRNKRIKNIAFVLPSLHVSGGVTIVLKHCSIFRKFGYDAFVINEEFGQDDIVVDGIKIPVLSDLKVRVMGRIDKVVATLWTTTNFWKRYCNVEEKFYLVQGFETDFYEHGKPARIQANQTYYETDQVKYITISKWCQTWLKERYYQRAVYIPNGIDLKLFPVRKRQFNGKIKILVEGNSDDAYKNVDESFQIIDRLDKEKFEIGYLSYLGKPKAHYYVNQFYCNVPHHKVGEIYSAYDILIKSSILESFSYPPLEMMATGGYAVVAQNEGNQEYLVDEENCLLYTIGDIDAAVCAVKRICEEPLLREKLYQNGLRTAQKREWIYLENEIVQAYQAQND